MYENPSSCEMDEDGELGFDKGDIIPESTLDGLSMLGKLIISSLSTERKMNAYQQNGNSCYILQLPYYVLYIFCYP
jgi:hypothetical protein